MQRLKLSRYEDITGSSAGRWLVKALPGLYLAGRHGHWRIRVRAGNYQQRFTFRASQQLLADHPQLSLMIFQNRSSALIALGQCGPRSDKPKALRELLGHAADATSDLS
jgi:hypothetical protein